VPVQLEVVVAILLVTTTRCNASFDAEWKLDLQWVLPWGLDRMNRGKIANAAAVDRKMDRGKRMLGMTTDSRVIALVCGIGRREL
jgi:hypothetical protein